MKQCVVRSYSRKYLDSMEEINDRLNDGWIVKHITPFIINGGTEFIEYILEMKEEKYESTIDKLEK